MTKQSKTTYITIVLTFIFYWFVTHFIKVEEYIPQILGNAFALTVFFLLLNKFNIFGYKISWKKQLSYLFLFISAIEILFMNKDFTSSLLSIAGYLSGTIITFLLFTAFSSLRNKENELVVK